MMTFIDGDQLDLFGAAPAAEDDGLDVTATGAWPMDCANPAGVRPCPHVTCRHHLLLDEVYSGPGEPSLAINRVGSLVQLRGRRRELSPDASRIEVERFIDEAVAALARLPDTCSREVARRARDAADRAEADRPYAMTLPEIAAVLGESDPDELVDELAALGDALRGEAIEAGAEPGDEVGAVQALAGRVR